MTDEAAALTPLDQVGDALVLAHTSTLHETWELTAGEQIVARLHDRFSGRATGELASGSYRLSRMEHGSFGVVNAAGTIGSFGWEKWQPPGHLPPDLYHVTWIGGIPDELRASYGNQDLLHLIQRGTFTAKHADVTISQAGRNDPHLEMLLLLVCHAFSSSGDIGVQNRRGFVGSGNFS